MDRAASVRRLVALAQTGRLGVEHVEMVAGAQGVSSRTVWRWVRQARAGEGLDRRPRRRFEVTDEIRQRLAFWRGNAAAVHRELVEAARHGGPVAPSLSTLQRAVARDLLAGDRAGLAGGERAHLREVSRPATAGAGAGAGVVPLRSGLPPIPAHWVLPGTSARPAASPQPDDSGSSASSGSSSPTNAAGSQ